MLSAIAGASTVLGVVGVGLAALDAVKTGNREELIKRQLHTEVCQAMDKYEQEVNSAANRRECCTQLANWLLVVGCLIELPLRWAWHSVAYLLFTLASALWWPLLTCNPGAAGTIAEGWTFCMLQVAHHQVHANLYLMSFSSLSSALCGGACCCCCCCCGGGGVSTPWFFQTNLDLLRPADPLISRHIYEGCCLPCLRLIKEYEPVLDPQIAAARYFRSMFFCLNAFESCHPALVLGRCCACCQYEGPVDRLGRWVEERAQERRASTARFYRDVYQVGSYEELEAARVAAYRQEEQQRLLAEGGGAAARSNGLEVARTAVGLLTGNRMMPGGRIGQALTAANYVVNGGVVQNGTALQPTAPPGDEEVGDVELGAAKAAGHGQGGGGRQSSPPPADGRRVGGGLLHLAAAAVQTAVEVGQEALARRQAGYEGEVAVAEAVPVVVAVEGGYAVPMAEVQKTEKLSEKK